VRIVLDTNVIVSGLLLTNSIPGQLLLLWEDEQYELVTSIEQIDEVSRVLAYDKLKNRIDPTKAKTLLTSLQLSAEIARELPEVSYTIDLADNLILGTAITGRVDILVSGDQQHLLPLGVVENIPILTPREALEKIWLARSS
jgi:putative PIN family toxin of toxin-antitoxin system